MLKFLQIHFFYDHYLEGFYQARPGLAEKPFKIQINELIKDGFSGIHMIAAAMHEAGYQSNLIIANNPFSQASWLKENNITALNSNDWVKEIAREQINRIKPDILYLSEPIALDSTFVRSLKHRPKLVIGWRAANIPASVDWSEFDIFLSCLKGIREGAKALGARSSEHFWPGFPTHLWSELKDIEPADDVVFCGQWTLAQHPKRNHYIEQITRWSKEAQFSFGLYLSGQLDKLTPEVAALQRRSLYGVEMYKAMRAGKICFDARGNIGLQGEGKVKLPGMEDLARKETANMRLFEATGVGSLLLTEEYDNLSELFVPGEEIVTYSSEEELKRKIEFYLKNDAERKRIAENGRRKCHAEHSLSKRVVMLDKIIKKHLDQSVVINTSTETPPVSDLKSLCCSPEKDLSIVKEQIMTLEKKPNAPEALDIAKATVLARSSDYSGAINVVKELLIKYPNHQRAKAFLQELEQQTVQPVKPFQNVETGSQKIVLTDDCQTKRPGKKSPLDEAVDLALAELKRGNTKAAFDITVKAKSEHVPVRDLDYVRALCFLANDNKRAALMSLQEELLLFPENKPARELFTELKKEVGEDSVQIIETDLDFKTLYNAIRPYTMLTPTRLFHLYKLARQVCELDIPGNFVECGVSGGGSTAMLCAIIDKYSKRPRTLFACDSYEGMPKPSEVDKAEGVDADSTGWGEGTCAAPETRVKEVSAALGVSKHLRVVKGYFENTLEGIKDEVGDVGFLHIDCDFYESTKTVLNALYPQVIKGAPVQVDDYGYWEGMERAIKDYQKENNLNIAVKDVDGFAAWFIKE